MASKGDKVRINRPESYWHNEVGTVVSVQDAGKYPVNVRFSKSNYFGMQGTDDGNTTNMFAENELRKA